MRIRRVEDASANTSRSRGDERLRDLEYARGKLDELRTRFANLETRIEVAMVKGDQALEQQLSRAREKVGEYMATLEASVDRLRDASDDAWEDVRYGLDQAWDDVAEASKRLVYRLAQCYGTNVDDKRSR